MGGRSAGRRVRVYCWRETQLAERRPPERALRRRRGRLALALAKRRQRGAHEGQQVLGNSALGPMRRRCQRW